MKKLVVLLTIILAYKSAWSQTLNDLNYEVVFCEPFNYQSNSTFPSHDFKDRTGPNIPVALSGSFTGDHAWDPMHWSFENGSWDGQVRYREDYAFLASPGIMRLTEQKLQTPYQDNGDWVYYEAGYLRLNANYDDKSRNYGYGIVEARIKFPDVTPAGVPGCPIAFWLWGHKHTEIDIFDVSHWNWYASRVWDHSYSPTHEKTEDVNPSNLGHSLAGAFHTFSAEWTPSTVRFYIDGNYINSINYELIRTYPYFYGVELAIMPYESGKDYGSGQFMDVDYVRILRRKCDESDLIVTESNGFGRFFLKYPESGRLFRHKNVNISSPTLLTLINSVPTVINAEATTIASTFIADQSVFTTSTVNLGDANNPKWVTRNSNAFLEITPLDCEIVPIIECNDEQPASKPGHKLKDTNTIMLANEPLRRTINAKSNTSYQPNNKNNELYNTSANINIHPNPTTGSFTVHAPLQGSYSIRVTNMMGTMVYETKLNGEQQKSIQLNQGLPAGTYTIQVTGEGIRHVEKLILTK